MELDEFKELYNTSVYQEKPTNKQIIEMIQLKSQGPLAELQKKIKYTLYLFPASIVFFLGLFVPGLRTQTTACTVTSWLLFLALFSEYIVAVLNYYTIKKMQQNTGPVKANLLDKIGLIRWRYRLYYVIYVALFSMIPLYLELGIRFPVIGTFQPLGNINAVVRFACYIVIFGGIFIIRKRSQGHWYDSYLIRLNRLADQLE